MPASTPASKLPRLDTPPAGRFWGAAYRALTPPARRRVFRAILLDESMPQPRKARRMRTLLDMGIWDPDDCAPDHRARQALASSLFKVCLRRKPLISHEVFHLGLEAGADPLWTPGNTSQDNFLTLFASRSQPGHFASALAAGADPYWRDANQHPPMGILLIHMANPGPWRDRALQMAQALLDAGVRVNDPGLPRARTWDEEPVPPLHTALSYSPDVGLPWMLAHGADVNCRASDGSTLAHLVCNQEGRDPSMITSLPGGQGLDLDARDNKGISPLWVAVRARNQAAVSHLLASGVALDVAEASPTHPDAPAKSLLQLLVELGEPDPWMLDLAARIEQAHPQCWSWPSTQAVPMDQWVQIETVEPQWQALAQRGTLLVNVDKAAPAPVSRAGPRL